MAEKPKDDVFDIIVDVIADGRVLGPTEIPAAVAAEIDAALARHEPPAEIRHAGLSYYCFIRPCVYP